VPLFVPPLRLMFSPFAFINFIHMLANVDPALGLAGFVAAAADHHFALTLAHLPPYP